MEPPDEPPLSAADDGVVALEVSWLMTVVGLGRPRLGGNRVQGIDEV